MSAPASVLFLQASNRQLYPSFSSLCNKRENIHTKNLRCTCVYISMRYFYIWLVVEGLLFFPSFLVSFMYARGYIYGCVSNACIHGSSLFLRCRKKLRTANMFPKKKKKKEWHGEREEWWWKRDRRTWRGTTTKAYSVCICHSFMYLFTYLIVSNLKQITLQSKNNMTTFLLSFNTGHF